MKAITYVGPGYGKVVRIKNRIYEFEWRKSIGIGSRQDEVNIDHAKKMASWRDKKGKKIFIIE